MKNKFGEQDCYGKDFGLSWNGKGICRVCDDKVSCKELFDEMDVQSNKKQYKIGSNEYDEAKVNK